MKKILIILLILLFIIPAYSYEGKLFNKNNSIQLDVLYIEKAILNYSLNYELLLINGNNFKTLSHVGFGWWPDITNMMPNYWYYIGIDELFSISRKHHAEFGVEYTYADYARNQYTNIEFIFFKLGYRYQNPDGNFMFRIAIKPCYSFNNNIFLFFNPSIAFGYAFSFKKLLGL